MYLYFNGTIMKEDNCFPLFVESKIIFIYKLFAIAERGDILHDLYR